MGLNRKLADLAQFIDSSSSGESITKSATGVGTKAVVSSDVQGSAGTFTFTDSSYIANVISPSYITSKTGKATSLTGTKSMFQGSMPDLIPQTTATYDLGDSAKPLAELVLDSSANLFFGSEAFTSVLSSGTANNVGGGGGGGSSIYGDRGLVSVYNQSIEYIDITTLGNASTFGSFTSTPDAWEYGALSDTTYGVFGTLDGFWGDTRLEYVTIASPGNATDFGNLSTNRSGNCGLGDGTYGLFCGGASSYYNNAGSNVNTIDYVTVASPGNATDFGDLSTARFYSAGASDGTYGIVAGGITQTGGSNEVNTIDYVTTATPGSASDFGDLTISVARPGAGSNETRMIIAGGYATGTSPSNVIQYITTATPGNATDFGDCTSAKGACKVTNNATRAVLMGGYTGSASLTTIDYVAIDTPGNGSDFGDLTVAHSTGMDTGISGSPS